MTYFIFQTAVTIDTLTGINHLRTLANPFGGGGDLTHVHIDLFNRTVAEIKTTATDPISLKIDCLKKASTIVNRYRTYDSITAVMLASISSAHRDSLSAYKNLCAETRALQRSVDAASIPSSYRFSGPAAGS